MPVIGILSGLASDRVSHILDALLRGLKQAGYYRRPKRCHRISFRGRFDRLPALAADLVRRQVTAIATLGGTIAVLEGGNNTDSHRVHSGRRSDQVHFGPDCGIQAAGIMQVSSFMFQVSGW